MDAQALDKYIHSRIKDDKMYYVLLALQQELCGVDVMEAVRVMTDGRVRLGPGTLYALLGDFQKEGLIEETTGKVAGGKRSYRMTEEGKKRLLQEHQRHQLLVSDFEKYYEEER